MKRTGCYEAYKVTLRWSSADAVKAQEDQGYLNSVPEHLWEKTIAAHMEVERQCQEHTIIVGVLFGVDFNPIEAACIGVIGDDRAYWRKVNVHCVGCEKLQHDIQTFDPKEEASE